MFYLNHFFQVIFKRPIKGILYLILLIAFVFSVSNVKVLEDSISKFVPKDQAGGHFFALVSNSESVSRVQRSMSKLPGVLRVEIMKKDKINSEVKKVMDNFKLNGEGVNLDVSGIKIVFEKDTQSRTKTLTREYLIRLVGEDKVTAGAIKEKDQNLKENKIIVIVREWGAVATIGILLILWLIFSFVIYCDARERAYLIAQFQRRSRVAFKMMLSGSCVSALFIGLIVLLVPTVDYLNLGIVLGIIAVSNLLFIGRLKWER